MARHKIEADDDWVFDRPQAGEAIDMVLKDYPRMAQSAGRIDQAAAHGTALGRNPRRFKAIVRIGHLGQRIEPLSPGDSRDRLPVHAQLSGDLPIAEFFLVPQIPNKFFQISSEHGGLLKNLEIGAKKEPAGETRCSFRRQALLDT
jgi:hypothetical protein